MLTMHIDRVLTKFTAMKRYPNFVVTQNTIGRQILICCCRHQSRLFDTNLWHTDDTDYGAQLGMIEIRKSPPVWSYLFFGSKVYGGLQIAGSGKWVLIFLRYFSCSSSHRRVIDDLRPIKKEERTIMA